MCVIGRDKRKRVLLLNHRPRMAWAFKQALLPRVICTDRETEKKSEKKHTQYKNNNRKGKKKKLV